MDIHPITQEPARSRLGALQFGLAKLLFVPLASAVCFALARWWGAAGIAAFVIVAVAAVSVRLRRLSPLVFLGCYVASYACLIRSDPAGRSYDGDYHQIAASYRVCDRYCQVLYRPAELADRELRPSYWRFDCVW